MLNAFTKSHFYSHVQKKQLLLTIVNSTATKRETKNYFLKYEPGLESKFINLSSNLGKFNPRVSFQQPNKDHFGDDECFVLYHNKPLRLAILKIKQLNEVSIDTLKGIGITIFKMVKLGVSPVIVIDDYDAKSANFKKFQKELDERYLLLLDVIENSIANSHGVYVRKVDNHEHETENFQEEHKEEEEMFEQKEKEENHLSTSVNDGMINNINPHRRLSTVPLKALFDVDCNNGVTLEFPKEILYHLVDGVIPIVFPIGYKRDSSTNILLPGDLVTENIAITLHDTFKKDLDFYKSSIEKIIYIDKFGGIPSITRWSSSHVLINLDQEYSDIFKELQKRFLKPHERLSHLSNLNSMNRILSNLPDNVCGIVTTPEMAAIDDLPLINNEGKQIETIDDDIQNSEIQIVDTYKRSYSYSNAKNKKRNEDKLSRQMDDTVINNTLTNERGELITSIRLKNPIIYNILTDRPLILPSLPIYLRNTPLVSTTVLRKGMDVTYFSSEEGLDLIQMNKDGVLNLQKFKELIDDSFKRSLNLENYLSRVNNKVAGIIIAGDYEGGAIITWEDLKSCGGRTAYLDKFAVKRSVQGTFGVADIVFNVMVDTLFLKELIWRSRLNNPVNKWYHERSNGSMFVENTHWRCFWLGTDTRERNHKYLRDYLEVCERIQPSWDK